MTLGQTIRGSVKWLLVGSIGNQFLQFVFGVVLARILVPADFGMLVTINVFTGVAGMVAAGGMGQALVQAKTADARDFRVVFTLQLAACALICAFFFAIAPWFPDWFGNPLYADLLRVSALGFLLRPLINLASAKLRREMRFKALSMIGVANLSLGSVASIGMALAGFGVWSLVLGGIAGSVINAGILIAVSGWRPAFGYDRDVARRLGLYGVKVSANDIVVYARFQANNFIISRAAGPAAVGLFNKADSLSVIPIRAVSFSTYQAVFRALASEQDNLDRSKYLYLRATTLVAAYAFPLSIGLWWGAEPFVRMVYGEKWLGAVAPLEVLALTGLVHCIENQSGAVTAAHNRLGTELYIQLGAFVFAVLGCAATVGYGLTATAWALFGVYVYSCTAMVVLACRILKVRAVELAKAIAPAMVLSAILLATLHAAEAAGLGALRQSHGWAYLASIALVGGGAYAIGFLFLPLALLRTEAERWKRLLRLQRGTAPIE